MALSEEALPQAQEVTRKQTLAELQNQLETKIEEANRVRSRMERNYQENVGNWEDERRRTKKQLETLEEQLREAQRRPTRRKRIPLRLSRPEDVVPQRRRHSKATLVVGEVMIEVRAPLPSHEA